MEEERKVILNLVNLARVYCEVKKDVQGFHESVKEIVGENIQFTYNAQKDVWEFKNNEDR